jgi:hypothetical protein
MVYNVTHISAVLLGNLEMNSPPFMEHEGSLPRSQERTV